jgi:uncharacterized protein YecE (DUF72 family)
VKNVKIGTCGFRYTKEEYVKLLSCVEIQHTFYNPPQIKTLERWREEVPADFEFTLKAWQLITHESKSPTYKRLRSKLTDQETEDSGAFKSTPIVKEALETTLDCAEALKARTVLFQCPASFKPTAENIENLRTFFSKIDRGRFNFCWEPRGAWDNKVIKDLCEELDLWHVVDPLVRRTVTPKNCYFRLHGIGGWRYKYEDGELEELASILPDKRLSYVFFNNNEMTDDAVRFTKIVEAE